MLSLNIFTPHQSPGFHPHSVLFSLVHVPLCITNTCNKCCHYCGEELHGLVLVACLACMVLFFIFWLGVCVCRPGPIKKKPSPNYFRDEEGVAYGVYDGCEIAEIMMRGNVLPPLTDEYEETDGEMKRHKKKKKGKKSKRDKSRDKSDVEAGSAQDEEKDKDVRNVGSSLDDLNHTVTEM